MKTSSLMFKQIQKARAAMAGWPKEWLAGIGVGPLPKPEDEFVNYDFDRMVESLKGPFVTLPHDVDKSAFHDWMAEEAKIIRERRP